MQYEVHPTDQTWDIDPELNGSFMNSTPFTVKIVKQEPDFSRTCGFRRMLADTLFYQFQQLKVPIPWLDFLQNVKNLIFWHIFVIFGWFRIFDQKRALSVSSYYRYLTSCKKSEWIKNRFVEKLFHKYDTKNLFSLNFFLTKVASIDFVKTIPQTLHLNLFLLNIW